MLSMRMMIRDLLFLVVFILLSPLVILQNAYGQNCAAVFSQADLRSDLPTVAEVSSPHFSFGFIVPNERNPEALKPYLKEASAGIYVTVGTERGFMSAAMMGAQTKVLVLADLAPKIVLFNRVNTALLSLAGSREHYVFLRTQANFEQLQNELNKAAKITKQDRALLSKADVWNWWTEQVQRPETWNDFHENSSSAYRGGNYLFDDRLFAPISQLAKAGRIFVYREDIQGSSLQERLKGLSQMSGEKISVLDMSNAWEEGYVGVQNTTKLVSNLAPLMTPETRLVLTYQARHDSQTPGSPTVFKYFVSPLASEDFVQKLPAKLASLLLLDPSRESRPRARMLRDDF